jgi:hypothetical protein
MGVIDEVTDLMLDGSPVLGTNDVQAVPPVFGDELTDGENPAKAVDVTGVPDGRY